MTDEEFEEYFNSIVNSDEFKELDNFLKISANIGETAIDKLKRHLRYEHRYKHISFPGYKEFRDFFEAYKNKEKRYNL